LDLSPGSVLGDLVFVGCEDFEGEILVAFEFSVEVWTFEVLCEVLLVLLSRVPFACE
jgi:hypothetical protein